MNYQNNYENSIAACFYTKDAYDKLLEVSDDRNSMCDTYDEWLYQFMKMKKGMEAEKVLVKEIFINIDELQYWCINNNKKNTGASRSQYILELANKYNK